MTDGDTRITMPSDLEIVITRTFNAPRRLVFEAWPKREHVKQWYSLKSVMMTVCEIDLRVGGKWRYVLRLPDGGEHGFWFGERGSPTYYKGTFSADGNTLSGAWVYPGGGGYSSTATRVK